jgi:rhodanese-related sulfurtransferase
MSSFKKCKIMKSFKLLPQLLLTALLWGGTVSCQTNTNPSESAQVEGVINRNVGVEEFADLINHGPEGILLDVRTDREFSMGHIKGANQIDFYRSDFQEELAKLDPEVPVYVYCRSGNRSGQAAQMMKQMGFTTVYNLQGGMGAWARKQPVAK